MFFSKIWKGFAYAPEERRDQWFVALGTPRKIANGTAIPRAVQETLAAGRSG